jgi:WXG100 family type VII secretion target
MAGNNTVYDYAVIEACNKAIAGGVDNMQQTADTMRKDVQKLVADTWGGDASKSYETTAAEINKDLERRQQNLFEVGNSLKNGAVNMQDTDSAGAKRLQV